MSKHIIRNLGLIMLVFLFINCKKEQAKEADENNENHSKLQIIDKPEFGNILDSLDLIGAITLYNPQTNELMTNDYQWSIKRQLPASTFKIPNTLIGLETGVIEGNETMFYWDSIPRSMSRWDKDMNLKEAFQLSCVPCYQQVARDIGVENMKKYVVQFQYGEMEIDSANIDTFWLMGDSKISPIQQIEFLQKLVENKLGVDPQYTNIVKNIMQLESNGNRILYAKTGLSLSDNTQNAWFVGFLENREDMYYFATNIEPKDSMGMETFSKYRGEVTKEALSKMNWMD